MSEVLHNKAVSPKLKPSKGGTVLSKKMQQNVPPPPAVPQGFVSQWSSQYQRYFFVNQATGQSQWEVPVANFAPPSYPPTAFPTATSHASTTANVYTAAGVSAAGPSILPRSSSTSPNVLSRRRNIAWISTLRGCLNWSSWCYGTPRNVSPPS
ncbi:hypothetical protein BDR26DRAFT_816940 [Obelidium mucronatum]|nr:hypothetical protein BDR26DRAFT_816940 [Obelidium mucronatum]